MDIDLNGLRLFLKERTLNPNCELCGKNIWSMNGPDGKPIEMGISFMDNPEKYIRLPLMRTIALICNHCGNVRLHSAHVIKTYLEKRGGQ